MTCLRCVVNKWVRARGWSDDRLAQEVGYPDHATLINRWRRGKGTLDAATGLRQALEALMESTADG
jgi:ribosome-binding protein aMBF1 (putative translation factor)